MAGGCRYSSLFEKKVDSSRIKQQNATRCGLEESLTSVIYVYSEVKLWCTYRSKQIEMGWKGEPVYLVGYSDNNKGYRVNNPNNNSITTELKPICDLQELKETDDSIPDSKAEAKMIQQNFDLPEVVSSVTTSSNRIRNKPDSYGQVIKMTAKQSRVHKVTVEEDL